MENQAEQVLQLTNNLNIKKKKKLRISLLLRLLEKTKDKTDKEFKESVSDLVKLLNDVINEGYNKKTFLKNLWTLKENVRKKYGFFDKGELMGETIGISVAIGLAVGAGLMTLESTFIAIGISIGAGVGVAVGANRERKESDKGNIY